MSRRDTSCGAMGMPSQPSRIWSKQDGVRRGRGNIFRRGGKSPAAAHAARRMQNDVLLKTPKAAAGQPLLAHGSSDMPVWGPIFRALDPSDARVARRVDNIVEYVESLQASSTAVNDSGSQLFRTYCASCHGPAARGNGPMAESLRRLPPDLTTYTARNGGVFPSERLRRIVDGRDVATHGDREMPVWGDAFKSAGGGLSEAAIAARIAAILKYLEGIQARSGD